MRKNGFKVFIGLLMVLSVAFGASSCDLLLSLVQEVETGTVEGYIFDYTDGYALSDVRIEVEDEDDYSTTTNTLGYFSFDVPAGRVTLELSKPGYTFENITINVEADETIEISEEDALWGQPTLDSDEFRIVLSWGSTPSDLDSHLITPSAEHIYFSDPSSSDGGESLDLDDTSGYGPETITISSMETGTYKYYVYNYSGYPDMSGTVANVKVFDAGGLVESYNIPASGSGLYWNVFSLADNRITDINEIQNTAP